ncbi:MAG: alpha/beta fold hydrolase [Anaerolineaceae bacterium]|nr:alpha/beta fold hydrolase [Anaerolineaceae bacterium]
MKFLKILNLLLLLTFAGGCAAPIASLPSLQATQTSPIPATATSIPAIPSPEPSVQAFSTEPSPLQVEVEREWSYPGSEITFEQTLQNRPSYDQFVVSYLSEGYKIYAYMAIPRGQKPETGWPSIILNHGYSDLGSYVTTEHYIAFMDVLARSGYIVFKPDFRAHGKSEGLRPVGGGYGSPDYMVDSLNALASVKAYKDADPERIGMIGHSMGGAITLRAMVVSKDIKAGVIWSGVVAPYATLVYRWKHSLISSQRGTPQPGSTETPSLFPEATLQPYSRNVSGWAGSIVKKYGTPEENPAFWDSISPSAHLKELSGPLQLQATWADPQVPAIWSEDLGKALEEAGKSYEVYLYENDDHNLTNNFLIAIQRTRVFLDKYVKNLP